MNLQNARILLTGGSSGIGKATAKLLVDKGATVLITGRDEEKLKRVATELSCEFIAADSGNEKDIQRVFEKVDEVFGGLDVLINNAGIGKFHPIEDLTFNAFEEIFKVNVYGAAITAKHAVERFKKQQKGNIINIASSAALKGFANGSVYSASKFALRSMTQCWQGELRKHNIRVMLINPSEVTTAFASEEREERKEVENKLTGVEIGHSIVGALEMDDRGFVTELSVWATNPF